MAQIPVLLPLRESTHTSLLSRYRIFWQGSTWEPFLLPAKGGFAVSRLAPDSYECTNSLMDQPGVYELALVKGKDKSQRYKVYIGQSSSLRRRFHQEYRGVSGSHLRPFFDEALANGCEIWRRCRYTSTAQKAKKRETQFLRKFDYAWNTRQAGCRPRHINLVVSQKCFSQKVNLVAKPVIAAEHGKNPLTPFANNSKSVKSVLGSPAKPKKQPDKTLGNKSDKILGSKSDKILGSKPDKILGSKIKDAKRQAAVVLVTTS